MFPKKTFKLRHRVPPKLDRALRWSKYILLALIAALLWTGLVSTDLSGPWSVFGQYTDLGSRPGLAPLLSVGGALLILIILASIFIERGFCRYLCPMGAVYAILSKLQRFPVLKKRDACGSCRSCSQSCAMALELGEVDAVRSGECIRCMRCAEICLSCGCDMVIANGSNPDNLYAILDGKQIGTTFTREASV